jgi:O-antigen/teichoic acid export membrane protein
LNPPSARLGRFLPHGVRQIAIGSIWLVLAAALGQGAMLLANLIVANLLGVADYGRYALLQSTVLMMAGIAQLSFALVVAQQVSTLRESEPALAGEVAAFCMLVTALLSLALTAALFVGRAPLAEALFRDEGLARGIAIGAIALPWAAIGAVQLGLFNGLERFRDQAAISLATLPVVIALPAFGASRGGLEGALAGLAGAYFLRSVVFHWRLAAILRGAGIGWSFANLRGKLRLLRNYALPATLSGLATMFAIWGGQTLLVRSPAGSVAVGMFAAAFAIKTMVMFVPTQMLGALMPALSRGWVRGDGMERRRLLQFNAAIACAIASLLAIAGMLFAPSLMRLFGEGFVGGETALRLLLLATPLEALTVTLYQDVQSRGRFWKNLWCVNVPLAVVVVAAAAWLVPVRLAEGLALAWLAGWAVALAGTILAMTTEKRT